MWREQASHCPCRAHRFQHRCCGARRWGRPDLEIDPTHTCTYGFPGILPSGPAESGYGSRDRCTHERSAAGARRRSASPWRSRSGSGWPASGPRSGRCSSSPRCCAFAEHVIVHLPNGSSVSGSVMISLAAVFVFRDTAPLLGPLLVGMAGGIYWPHLRQRELASAGLQHGGARALVAGRGGRVLRGDPDRPQRGLGAARRGRGGGGVLARGHRPARRHDPSARRGQPAPPDQRPVGLRRLRDRRVRRPRGVPRAAVRGARGPHRRVVHHPDPRGPPGVRVRTWPSTSSTRRRWRSWSTPSNPRTRTPAVTSPGSRSSRRTSAPSSACPPAACVDCTTRR